MISLLSKGLSGVFSSTKIRKHQFFNIQPSLWSNSHIHTWPLENWCFLIVVLEKTLESPLDSKEIKPVNPKGNYPWIFSGRTVAEPDAPILWPPDAKSRFIGKDPDAGKDWRQEAKGTTNDKTVGWHHQLNGHKFEQTPGDGEGQGSLAWGSPLVLKESEMTEWLKNENKLKLLRFKGINSSALSFLYSPTLTSIHDYWKNHSFD